MCCDNWTLKNHNFETTRSRKALEFCFSINKTFHNSFLDVFMVLFVTSYRIWSYRQSFLSSFMLRPNFVHLWGSLVLITKPIRFQLIIFHLLLRTLTTKSKLTSLNRYSNLFWLSLGHLNLFYKPQIKDYLYSHYKWKK